MDHSRHLDALFVEGQRLAAMPAEHLEAPVPTVEGWTLEQVVRHTGKVHRWVTAVLAAGPDADLQAVASSVDGLPRGAACLPAYAEALGSVHAALTELEPDEPVASFIGPATARFWQRRQAHEVAVHRIDAADAVHAAGGPVPEPLELDLAADGIDEWARVFVAIRWNQRFGPFPAEADGWTVQVRGTGGGDAGWVLSFADGSATVDSIPTEGGSTGDVTLRGSNEGLLLVLWRRRPLDAVEVEGDRAVVEGLLDLARF